MWGADWRRDELEGFQVGSECDCSRHKKKECKQNDHRGNGDKEIDLWERTFNCSGRWGRREWKAAKTLWVLPSYKAPVADKDMDQSRQNAAGRDTILTSYRCKVALLSLEKWYSAPLKRNSKISVVIHTLWERLREGGYFELQKNNTPKMSKIKMFIFSN